MGGEISVVAAAHWSREVFRVSRSMKPGALGKSDNRKTAIRREWNTGKTQENGARRTEANTDQLRKAGNKDEGQRLH